MRYLACSPALALALLAASTSGVAAQTTEQSMYVSVVDRDGAPVTALGPDAFVVREDGRTREVLRVAPATDPIDVAVLVDNSQAATPHVTDLRNALRAFATRMAGDGHSVAIVGLADRPTILQDYTTSATLLERGVERIFAQPGSGMRLLDAILDVGQGIQRREHPRRVIVSITTEGAEFSTPNHQRVIEVLRTSRASLYSFILTRGGGTMPMSDEARSRSIVFDEGTRTSGGRQEQLLTSMALRGALDGLVGELENQLHVVYARPGALIPPERIEVTVTRPDLRARGTPAAGVKPAAGGDR
jgi:VWFA-related protein